MKRVWEFIAFLVVLPFLLLNRLGLLTVFGASILLGFIPLRPGYLLRRAYFRRVLGSCEEGAVIGRGVEIRFDNPKKLYIGKEAKLFGDIKLAGVLYNTYEVRLGPKSVLYFGCRIAAAGGPVVLGEGAQLGYNCVVRGPLRVGNWCGVGHNVVIVGFQHTYEDPEKSIFHKDVKIDPVVIEDEAWIGSNVYIGSGVTIGRHAVVGAGSVVTRDIPPYCVAVGNPARVIKRYDFEAKQWVKAFPLE